VVVEVRREVWIIDEVVKHDVHLECARHGLIDLLNGLVRR
jgi:hypothetical protein